MLPMQMPAFTSSVQVIKVAFGRFQMAMAFQTNDGPGFFFHKMLFPAEHKARLEAQVARIQDRIDAGEEPRAMVDMAYWYAAGSADKPKLSIFKPKTA